MIILSLQSPDAEISPTSLRLLPPLHRKRLRGGMRRFRCLSLSIRRMERVTAPGAGR